ncbi:hypothetical protein CYME_CMC093C [Cyanidioschyzon merolae strain 10D]|uniref:GOLD domain-containing protein n=1 Tax=Cyanidioschyzon merolae (strain NIES-3377 / 10D) TaxID=280699 RepID=M1VAB1_CYAM1|nr:hypothetical protein CYME_CMC093C [Cyanidioschyzon merolae strain 10D]BAM79027.1 hypothetical protein CYME_CMC093C [Cyanidioschyzon merolae strain 10D]|eukprot:XP_005535313.1 hypothetical protein CYME_CMC093C [Cyanidioschyzon merolae strain 10D]
MQRLPDRSATVADNCDALAASREDWRWTCPALAGHGTKTIFGFNASRLLNVVRGPSVVPRKLVQCIFIMSRCTRYVWTLTCVCLVFVIVAMVLGIQLAAVPAEALTFDYVPVPRVGLRDARDHNRNPNCFFTTGAKGDLISGHYLVVEPPKGAAVEMIVSKLPRDAIDDESRSVPVLALPAHAGESFSFEVTEDGFPLYRICFAGAYGPPRKILFEWQGGVVDEVVSGVHADKKEPIKVGHIQDLEAAVDHLQDRVAQVGGAAYYFNHRLGLMLEALYGSSTALAWTALLKTLAFMAISWWKVSRVKRMLDPSAAAPTGWSFPGVSKLLGQHQKPTKPLLERRISPGGWPRV